MGPRVEKKGPCLLLGVAPLLACLLLGAGPTASAAHESGQQRIASLMARDAVASVEPLTVSRGPGAPNDPLFRFQWHLRAIQIPKAWAVSTGKGATVAVLDTGVAYENAGRYRRAPDLAGTRFVPGWDFVDGDAHPNDDVVPRGRGHGTHVTGVIAQTSDNGEGAAGVAPHAAIMPVRVLRPDGGGSSLDIARGLRHAADHGVRIVNLSFGGDTEADVVADAVAYARARGVTIVASSGNEGASSLSFPAAYPEVIAVGAVRIDKARAGYSNYGQGLDLVAPGGDLTVDQNHDGSEDGVVQQTITGDASTFCYCFVGSTSAAAAHVTGVAALLMASGVATTPDEIRSALLSSAQDLGSPGWDREFGHGLVQASTALSQGPERPSACRARGPDVSRSPLRGRGGKLEPALSPEQVHSGTVCEEVARFPVIVVSVLEYAAASALP